MSFLSVNNCVCCVRRAVAVLRRDSTLERVLWVFFAVVLFLTVTGAQGEANLLCPSFTSTDTEEYFGSSFIAGTA